LQFVVGGDREGHRVHGEGPGDVADRVVGVGRPGGGDAGRVAADVARRGGGGAEGRGAVRGRGEGRRGVAVDEPAEARRERRQRGAVVLDLVLGGEREGHRVHGEGPGDVADRVVGVGRPGGSGRAPCGGRGSLRG